MAAPIRQRIAILGGGMAALATAVELTSQPDWQERFEITVYQLGWRLGGKGASSRNRRLGDRIEEHGLHVWFGCYDRAFALLRTCYQELDRPSTAPFPTLESAFQAQDDTPYFEFVDGHWSVWPVWFPPNPSAPGTGGELPTAWDMVVMLVESLVHLLEGLLHIAPATAPRGPSLPDWLVRHIPAPLADAPDTLLHGLERLVHAMPRDPVAHQAEHHLGIIWLIGAIKGGLLDRPAPDTHGDAVRRMLIELDLGLTMVGGLVADGVPSGGFGVIDGEDTRAWFTRHGARPETVDSSPIRALYDLYFAYVDGDIAKPGFSAAVAIAAVMRLALTYKGAVVNEMRAGMGEVVIAPVYQVLAARGVRFAFFNRVDRLELSEDGSRVERVAIGRQVALKDGSIDGYRPLFDVDGLPCWPIEPLYDQIVGGDGLDDVDLESYWTQHPDAGATVLQAGTDYDQIVLGISLAALRPLAADLVARHPAWADLLSNVATMQTVSAQLWMTPSLEGIGWTHGPVPADAAPEPLDVWADRTDTLQREGWPAGSAPGSVQYLCGPLPGDWAVRPPSDAGVPAEAQSQAHDLVSNWLDDHGPSIWPLTAAPGGGFDWSVLYDTSGGDAKGSGVGVRDAGGVGVARLEGQFLRANIDPTERYVLSLPGTARYRLGADESGCTNLVLAGDWTRTDWNVGCIEAAVTSGLNAAAVVTTRAAASEAGGGKPPA